MLAQSLHPTVRWCAVAQLTGRTPKAPMDAVEGAPPAAMGRYQRQSRRDALLRPGGEPPRRHIGA